MTSNLNSTTVKRGNKKIERLALIKERYKKLILGPRKEIESEIERDMSEEATFNHSNSDSIQ